MSANRHWRLFGSAVGFLIASAPIVALACPVCFAAKDEANRLAFLGTTLLLTGLPLAMIGGFIFWIARRVQAMDAQLEEQPTAAAEPFAVREDGPARAFQSLETT